MYSHVGRFPNLVNPSGQNDKIQWLKLFSRDPIQAVFADKFLVREWVTEQIGGQYLIPLRAYSFSASEVPPEALKDPFVAKASHDCGSAVVVDNPDPASSFDALVSVENALRSKFGVQTAEWGYRGLKPRILIEDLLAEEGGRSLSDYKFHCSRGQILWAQVIWDRDKEVKEAIIEADGSPTTFKSLHASWQSSEMEALPNTWEEMCRIAKVLSRDRPYVRVDLYSVSDKVFFGEMTNWPCAGCCNNNGDLALGERIHLPPIR